MLGVLLPVPSSVRAQEPISDAEMVIRFGEGEPISEFANPQPADAVTDFQRLSTSSRFLWGDPVSNPWSVRFAAPAGLSIEGGVRVESTFGEVFSLGRLILGAAITEGGEATAIDLQIAVMLTRPAVLEPLLVTLPLTIEHVTQEFADGSVWTVGAQINLPQSFPTIDTMANGIPYKLKLIGFGSIGPDGTITTVSSLIDDQVNDFADLLAELELACDELPNTTVGTVPEQIRGFGRCGDDHVGKRSVVWGSFGLHDALEADSKDRLELECIGGSIPSFQLFFKPKGRDCEGHPRCRVGLCPFLGGCNHAWIYHSGDSNKNNKPDCFVRTRWISKDYGDNDAPFNPWTKELEIFSKLDWAISTYDVIDDNLFKADWAYDYAVGPPVPSSYCDSGKAEGGQSEFIPGVDPPLGNETETFFDEVLARLAQVPGDAGLLMLEDTSKACDLNGDQLCDALDVQLFEARLGSCLTDGGYHPQADIDGSGCIDAQDRFHMFEVDRDADGIPDTADNCLVLANGLQEDGDGDRTGDVCDSCPVYATRDLADTDGDGRGDECECTDQNGDGRNTVSDLIAINTAIFNPSLATPLCDGTNDGLCDVNDIIAANIEIFSPTNTSTCARQPVPGP